MVSYVGIFLGCAIASAIAATHEMATGRPILRTRGHPKLPPLSGRAQVWHFAIMGVVYSLAVFTIASVILIVGLFRGWWGLPPFIAPG